MNSGTKKEKDTKPEPRPLTQKEPRRVIVQWQKGVPVTVYPPKEAISSPIWPKQ